MTEEKWGEIIDRLKTKFEVLEQGEEEVENNGKGFYFIFSSPMGKIKLERILRPRLLDKKTTYSNRIGSSVSVDYVYSEDEIIDKLKIYRFNENSNEWVEFSGENLINS